MFLRHMCQSMVETFWKCLTTTVTAIKIKSRPHSNATTDYQGHEAVWARSRFRNEVDTNYRGDQSVQCRHHSPDSKTAVWSKSSTPTTRSTKHYSRHDCTFGLKMLCDMSQAKVHGVEQVTSETITRGWLRHASQPRVWNDCDQDVKSDRFVTFTVSLSTLAVEAREARRKLLVIKKRNSCSLWL